jgi:hypothetical protein
MTRIGHFRRIQMLLLLALGVLLQSAGCWVDRRSDELRCGAEGNCPSGRYCLMGWCVVGTAPPIDAMPFVCPEECTRCSGTLCIIECIEEGSCAESVLCAGGMPCEVRCSGTDSCGGGVACEGATSCKVTCDGLGSCASQVVCSAGACDVTCSGTNSCAGGIDCSSSCACHTSCSGSGACDGVLQCPSNCERQGECRTTGGGCSRC